MRLIANCRIATKLTIYSILNIIMLCILIALASNGLRTQRHLIDSIFSESFRYYVAAGDIINPIKDINISIYNTMNMVSGGFPDEDIARAAEPLPARLKAVSAKLEALTAEFPKGDPRSQIYAKIYTTFQEYQKAMELVITAISFDADIAFASLTTVESQYTSLNEQLEELMALEAASMEDKAEKSIALSSSINRSLIILSLCIAVITLVLGFIMSRSISSPIRQLMHFASALSGGDLTARFTRNTHDEAGELGGIMNKMAEQLEESMNTVAAKAQDAQDEAESARQAEARAEELAAKAALQRDKLLEAAQKLEIMVTTMKESATELDERTSSVSSAMGEQSSRLDSTADRIAELNSSVTAIAGNAELTAEKAFEASGVANSGASDLRSVIQGIGDVQKHGQNLKDNMDELGSFVGTIGQIIGIINDIADQTNLLALNAAIEAARAGEAGRGFAVVADEVRKLAEKTIAAIGDVTDNISAIQSSSKRSREAVDEAFSSIENVNALASGSGKLLENIVEAVHGTSTDIRSIASAAEQQTSTFEEITRTTTEVSELSGHVLDEIQHTSKAAERVAELAAELHDFIEAIRIEE